MPYTIIKNTCTGCTVCAKKCPTNAIYGEKSVPHAIREDLCISCGLCGKVCRFEAILNDNQILCLPSSKKDWEVPIWDMTNCTECNICVYTCPVNAIYIKLHDGPVDFPYILDISRCIGCGICAKDCPINVIQMTSKTQPARIN